MIKAEVINTSPVCGELVMQTVQFEAKGTHHDIVVELRSIIESFNEQKDYQVELLEIIKDVLECGLDNGLKELEKLKEDKKRYDQS